VDYIEFQKILDYFSYGLYAVCSNKNGKLNGQISNAVMQVTALPPRVVVCINKVELTWEYIKESGTFTINILSEDAPMKYIGILGYRSGRDSDKFSKLKYKLSPNGNPILTEYCIGVIEANVIGEMDVNSHTLFLGEVIYGEKLDEGVPLTYDYFKKIKGGKAPKNAPTYRFSEKELSKKTSILYECAKCRYIYNSEKGDPDNNVEPGTLFENLSDFWTCPLCGNGKRNFRKLG